MRRAAHRHPLSVLGCTAGLVAAVLAIGAEYLADTDGSTTMAADPSAAAPGVVNGRIVPSDQGFAAALPSPGRPNRVRRGDDDAVASFDTTVTSGSLTALPTSGDPEKGVFSPVFEWPLIGIHAVLTPDGRVLTYGSSDTGKRTGYFSYAIWDPQLGLGPESHNVLPNETAVDLFCNVQLLLPTGNIEMWGGDITNVAGGYSLLEANDDSNLFNPLDDSLIRTGKMHRKRWYASATTLPDGQVYIQGGSGGGDTTDTGGKDYPEVRTATGQFRLLTGADTYYLNALYPRNFLAPDGKVFGLHYSQMYRVDPSGPGALTRVGKFSKSNIGGSSTSVMFAPGKILQVGGGLDDDYASPDAHVVDIHPDLPVIKDIAKPHHRRHWGNAIVLPDGRVFLSGGSTADNDARNGVAYTSEIYDPKLDKWAIAATAQRMRLYHSASMLLPDATVLTVGGGANGPELNFNAEIFYPPYLFNDDGSPASRPIIDSLPMTIDPAKAVRIGTADPSAIRRVTMVKSGSNTHSVDMDQRFLELDFVVDGGDLLAQLPANRFATPPGFYLVFLFDRNGVPSEARPMRVNVIGATHEVPATLTVKKVVVNDDGGSKSAADFSFSVNGATPVAFEADGTNVLSVPAGTYTVTEPPVAGYVASYSGCNDVVLVAGDGATCTITNDDEAAPSAKNLLVNGDFEAGSTGWGMHKPWSIAGGQATKTSTAGGNVYQEFAFESGATYEVTYTVVSISGGSINTRFINGTGATVYGTNRSEPGTYTQQLVAGDHTRFAINAPIATAAVIDNVVMVKITNSDQAPTTLTIRKVVVNDDGGSNTASDFSFSVNGATPVAFEADGTNVLSVPAGTYTVTEPPVVGYVASYSGCKDVVLVAGDSATCTITNDDEAAPTAENLLVNGDFEAGSTGWGMHKPWSIAGGQATKSSTAGGNVYQEFAFESGATYEVTYTVVSISGGSINTRFINGTGATVYGTNRSEPGTYTQQLVAGDHTRFAINAPIGTAAVIDNVVMVRTTW